MLVFPVHINLQSRGVKVVADRMVALNDQQVEVSSSSEQAGSSSEEEVYQLY